MPRKRLIPKLLLSTSRAKNSKLVVVVTKNFESRSEIGSPVSQAKIFQDQSADELIFLNIDRNNNNIEDLSKIISEISEEIFMPLTVGGGVNSDNDFRMLLKNGADKISINSKALENPHFIREVSDKYGSQCVVVSIDYKIDENGNCLVFSHGGKVKTNYSPLEFALLSEKMGAGELLITCIDNDGMRGGLNLNITKEIVENVKIPVIASGGCGLACHFTDGFIEANVDAISAGNFFAHRDQNLVQTRAQILNSGVDIRNQKNI